MRRRVAGGAAMAALALFGGPAGGGFSQPADRADRAVPARRRHRRRGRAFAEAARTHIPRSIVVLNKPAPAAPSADRDDQRQARRLQARGGDGGRSSPWGWRSSTRTTSSPSSSSTPTRPPSPCTRTRPGNYAGRRQEDGGQGVGGQCRQRLDLAPRRRRGEKTGIEFNHIPFQGASPAQALLGKHVDAVAVSPAEVAQYASPAT